MKRLLGVVLACVAVTPLVLFGLSSRSRAHSPYIWNVRAWVAPDGASYEIALHYCDGIFFADPSRPVVLKAGMIVAQGPLATAAYVYCESARRCVVLDFGRTFEPDPGLFSTGRHYREIYPEHERTEFGFRSRPMNTRELLLYGCFLAADYLLPNLLLAAAVFGLSNVSGRLFGRAVCSADHIVLKAICVIAVAVITGFIALLSLALYFVTAALWSAPVIGALVIGVVTGYRRSVNHDRMAASDRIQSLRPSNPSTP